MTVTGQLESDVNAAYNKCVCGCFMLFVPIVKKPLEKKRNKESFFMFGNYLTQWEACQIFGKGNEFGIQGD